MPVDYLDSLRKFSAGGGTDINAFLKQHTLPDQTTPGPSVPKPVSDITPPPTPPTNVVRQSMGATRPEIAAFDRSMGLSSTAPGEKPEYQQILDNRAARLKKDPYDLDYAENTSGTFGSSNAQLEASRTNIPAFSSSSNVVKQATGPTPPKETGALSSLPLPRPVEGQRSEFNSRNSYPPQSEWPRILGESRAPTPITVAPAAPQPARTAFTPPVPVLGTAPRQPAATPAAPAEDPFRFRLPSEKASNRDFITGKPISAAETATSPGSALSVLPRKRNQRAIVNPTVPRIFSGAA